MAENSGIKTVTRLRKYINGKPTRDTKLNTVGDPNYVPPYTDSISCPIKVVAPPVAPPSVTPSPSSPVPVFVVIEETGPTSNTCTECSTEVIEDVPCHTYELFNESQDETVEIQYESCDYQKYKTKKLRPNEEAFVKSSSKPIVNEGKLKNLIIYKGDAIGVKADITKFHYISKNCFNDKEKRYISHTSQLSVGSIVKTEHSTCCWEIEKQVSARSSFSAIINETTPVYSTCSDCCTGATALVEPSKLAVMSGTTSTSVDCSTSLKKIGIFTVSTPGFVEVKYSISVVTGNLSGGGYVRGTGRLVGITGGAVVTTFPLNPYSYPPYVQDVLIDGNGAEEVLKVVELKIGTYRIEVDPLSCGSGSWGTATVTVTAK